MQTLRDLEKLENLLHSEAVRLVELAQEMQAHQRRCMSLASEVKQIARRLAPITQGKGLRPLGAAELRHLADVMEQKEKERQSNGTRRNR